MDAFWIILTGILIAFSCGLLGCFLVLRKMTMIGDAISHAVLPGIVIAFLLSGARDNVWMLLGAAILGLLATIIIQWLSSKIRLQKDASIGITFTWLFALGVILIALYTENIDIDQDCVLHGEIALIPLNAMPAGFPWMDQVPSTIWLLLANLLVILVVIFFGFKGFYITSFNEEYARSLGILVGFWHYLLMSMVSVTSVVSFEAVGAILVVAFIVIPPATAYLLTHDIKKMIIYTFIVGLLSAIGGYYFSVSIDSSISAGMVVVAGFMFICTLAYSIVAKNKKQEITLPI